MQGQLRNEKLSAHIETECAHCHQPMQIEIDSDLNIQSVEPGAQPLVFTPMVDFSTLKDPSIIDAF
ncbi:MAG: hypothetical protein HZB51_13940 [Chloroflexi bacterium]|nr:hypothetical protein [Chloroflexota bacterium]